MMKRLLTRILLGIMSIVTFQSCEEDPTSSGIGPLYVIEVNPPAVNMEIDSTQQFTAIGRDVDMNVIPDLTFTWTSRYPLVGVIDANGLLSGLSSGITMITAKSGNIESAEAAVNVYDPVFSIVLTPETLTLDYATTGSFTAVGKDINDDDISGFSYNWETDNTDVASVDENGLVTGVSAGTTSITASLREVKSLPATVTIEMILPSITSADVTNIISNTAIAGGTIIHNGGGELSAVGVCWSTSDPPTIEDNYTTIEVDTGSFIIDLNTLYFETTYFVRAFATNAAGTRYGSAISFTCPLTVTDIDGNIYSTIQIGNQVWMAENLRVAHYRNSDPIPNITNNGDWGSLSTGAYGVYDNDESNADPYGYLYNGYAVDDSRNIAPEGWHVPTDAEWKELEMSLGMSQSEADDTGWRGTNEGSKLASNAELWSSGILEDDSEFGSSGFNALPCGLRDDYDGNYELMGEEVDFWSSDATDDGLVLYRYLDYNKSDVYRHSYFKEVGFSIRCLRD